MRWWDWTDEQLSGAMPLFTGGDIVELHGYWTRNVRSA